MKRGREEVDASLDPITCEPWRKPQVLSCGHVVSKSYTDKLRNANGLVCCPLCRQISRNLVTLRISCLISDSCADGDDSQSEDKSDKPKKQSIKQVLNEARERRRTIFQKCMTALGELLVKEIALHHWRSSTHLKIAKQPSLIFPFNGLQERGVFHSPEEYLICYTFQENAYETYFANDGISLNMWVRSRKTCLVISDYTQFRANPQLYDICIQYQCLDGYDG